VALRPLHYRKGPIPDECYVVKTAIHGSGVGMTLESVIISEILSVLAIALHSHLLPPSHSALCIWGIDEMIIYVSLFY